MRCVYALLVSAVVCLAQIDPPKIDPLTGLPISGRSEANDKELQEKLAGILQGADRNKVHSLVHDLYADVPKDLIKSLETKLELGLKRSGLRLVGQLDRDKGSVIEIRVGTIPNGYDWEVGINRWTYIYGTTKHIKMPSFYSVSGGKCSSASKLKEVIDTALDKIFLAYVNIPKPTQLEIVKDAIRRELYKKAGTIIEADIKSVTGLDFTGKGLTDEGLKLSYFSDAKQLRVLELGGTLITDEGLKEIAKHKELIFIRLDNTKVTKAGVEQLKKGYPSFIVITSNAKK